MYLTPEITNQAIEEITGFAGAAPAETVEIIEAPNRYLADAGMTATQSGNIWETPIMEEEGQKFQGYIWQHESGYSLVATVLR
jgi:hypothetical protein